MNLQPFIEQWLRHNSWRNPGIPTRKTGIPLGFLQEYVGHCKELQKRAVSGVLLVFEGMEGAKHQKHAWNGMFVVLKGSGRGREGGTQIRVLVRKDEKHAQTGVFLVFWRRGRRKGDWGAHCWRRALVLLRGIVLVAFRVAVVS